MVLGLPRVVPWISNQEFVQVFDWLYADIEQRPDLVQLGVDRVKAWCSRGRVPISVKATMDLVELQLREHKQQQQNAPLSQNELRLLYSSAMTRFVNIIEDSLQTKVYAKSLFQIAREIGLPTHLVQLRHAATHEELPSLPVLRRSSIDALQWLFDSYWTLQIKPDVLAVVNDKTMDSMSAIFSTFKESRKAYLKGGKSVDKQIYMDSINKLKKLLSKEILQDSIIVILLKIGGLVPTAKKKRNSTDNMTLSSDLLELWSPLLQELDKHYFNFTSDLVSCMLKRIDTDKGFNLNDNVANVLTSQFILTEDKSSEKFRQPSYLLTITSWLRYFVTEFYNKQSTLYEHPSLNDMLTFCLKNPNVYTRSVLQAMTAEDSTLAKDIAPFIIYIDRFLSTPASPDASTNISTEGYPMMDYDDAAMDQELNTLNVEREQLESKLGLSDAELIKCKQVGNDTFSGWTLLNDKEWSPCPIGSLPNGKIPDLTANDPMLTG